MVMAEIDRNTPATKGDLIDLEERMRQRMLELEERMMERMTELVRDVETKLLGAFYGYAKSNDNRVLEAEANEGVLRKRVATLETRVTDIEERLNRPKQP